MHIILSLILSLFLTSVLAVNAAGNDNARMNVSALLKTSAEQLTSTSLGSNLTLYKSTTSQHGFALILGEGDNSRVIAYSADATLDPNSDNPSFKWWINAVKKISAQRASTLATTKPDPARFPLNVDPLLTTKWGQREPFKFMCPFDTYVEDSSLYGTYTPNMGHYSVGCTATAMAQYMNYYKFPQHGVGQDSVTVSYTVGLNNVDVVYKVDFEHATYDWANMIDDYQGEYTAEQGQAVAQLCYHCGVAAQSLYNHYGAGSTDAKCLEAFITHFNYNDTARYIVRSNYTEPQWMEQVYTMLSNNHPILYSGKDINLELGIIAGHNFIIDGYDQNGLVHVNWGWYGLEDGFFDIALLNPQQYTYDDWQAMYIGLYPNQVANPCDVNRDGSVTSADITIIYNYLLTGDQTYLSTSDVNGDGSVTSSDITSIYNILLGN